jgi:Diguanylate cyclase, GGDEF domain
VNHRLGYDHGDQLLKTLARTLTETISGDQLAARMGGDEFIVIVPTATAKQAKKCARHRATRALGMTPWVGQGFHSGWHAVAVTARSVVIADGMPAPFGITLVETLGFGISDGWRLEKKGFRVGRPPGPPHPPDRQERTIRRAKTWEKRRVGSRSGASPLPDAASMRRCARSACLAAATTSTRRSTIVIRSVIM